MLAVSMIFDCKCVTASKAFIPCWPGKVHDVAKITGDPMINGWFDTLRGQCRVSVRSRALLYRQLGSPERGTSLYDTGKHKPFILTGFQFLSVVRRLRAPPTYLRDGRPTPFYEVIYPLSHKSYAQNTGILSVSYTHLTLPTIYSV